jgi:hypothetical protein
MGLKRLFLLLVENKIKILFNKENLMSYYKNHLIILEVQSLKLKWFTVKK